tara:strand:- start:10972 stop:13191 length:2220 start_codon:yes stop_codon:yes gene_type:complete
LAQLGPGGKGIETEARFGIFKDGRFIPGVTKNQLEELVKLFKGWKKEITVDKVTSRTLTGQQSVRQIQKNGKNFYELKEKLQVVDFPPAGVRLVRSSERMSDAMKNVFNNASKNKNYIQTRNRMSFYSPSEKVRIDATQLDRSFQFEIEFTDKKEACKYIELVAGTLEKLKFASKVVGDYRSFIKSPRFIGSLPQTLTLEAFDKKVLSKYNYSVTEKADGERYLMYVTKDGYFTMISRSMKVEFLPVTPTPAFAHTILDGEFVNNVFYAFDIAYTNGKNVMSSKLPARLTQLDTVIKSLGMPIIKMKKFLVEYSNKIIEFPSKKDTTYKNIYEAAAAVWSVRKNFPYGLDGLIFTPVDEPYQTTRTFKWKDDNTIDFYYDGNKLFIAGNDKNGSYSARIPFSGIDDKGGFELKGKMVTNQIFIDKTAPTQVRNGILTSAIPGPPGVGEFTFVDNTFKLLKKRPDKEFPNGIAAVNQAWEAVVNTLSIEKIAKGPRFIRDFHSEIKSNLIMKYTKGKRVLDIGSGKGEDVGKYVKAGVKSLVGIDLVKEEYAHPNYMSFHKANNPVYRVKNFSNTSEKFDVININFAIHYFLQNKKLFESLMINIHENMKKGGYLMATVLDGRLVFDSLKGKNKLNTNSVLLKSNYNNSKNNFNSPKFKFLGQKVDVLLKYSKYFANKPITEYLFNFKKFLKIMEEFGFKLVETKNFSELCSDSKWCSRYMSNAEKDYSFKNIFFVLKKE